MKMKNGNSREVRCLGLGAFTAVAQVQSLVRELKSHKPRGTAKKIKMKSDFLSSQGVSERGRLTCREYAV